MSLVLVDNNFLIELVNDKTAYRAFIQSLENTNGKIALATPILAEFLAIDDNFERELFLSKTSGVVQIFDFDIKSAQLSANIMRALIKLGYFAQKSKDRQIVKVDIQLLGIALANQIPRLLTTDNEIIKIINLLELPITIE